MCLVVNHLLTHDREIHQVAYSPQYQGIMAGCRFTKIILCFCHSYIMFFFYMGGKLIFQLNN